MRRTGGTPRRGEGTAGERKKVHWRCVVPGCNSNSEINRHSFPKDVMRSEKWRQAIKNPNLDGLTSNELRNRRVCQLHFPESAYKITSVRQVLKEDAVPELLLNLCPPSTVTPASTSGGGISGDIEMANEKMQLHCTLENVMNENSDFKSMPSWSDICTEGKPGSPRAFNKNSETCTKKIFQKIGRENHGSNVKGGNLSVLKKNRIPDWKIVSTEAEQKSDVSAEDPVLKGDLENTPQDILLEPSSSMQESSARNHTSKQPAVLSISKNSRERTLLGSVTGKPKLISVTKRLSLSSLTPEQLRLIGMQIRSVHKKAKSGEKCLPSCQFH